MSKTKPSGFLRVMSGNRITHGDETFLGGQRVPADHPCVEANRWRLVNDKEEPPEAVRPPQHRSTRAAVEPAPAEMDQPDEYDAPL